MRRISGIYKITNTVNGKAYIGRSVDVYKRWAGHKSAARLGRPYPIYNAIRKYGEDAFTFEILLECDGAILREKELEAINAHGTWADDKGYNVGGTDSGFPSSAEMELMDESIKNVWLDRYRAQAQKGHAALAKKREDEKYEAQFLEIKSKASFTREARIRERRAVDPAYDRKIREIRRKASTGRSTGGESQRKAAETFRQRFATDPEYAARVSANRTRAARGGHKARAYLDEAAVYYAQLWRLEGALLTEISEITGRSVPWASVHTRGLKNAALS